MRNSILPKIKTAKRLSAKSPVTTNVVTGRRVRSIATRVLLIQTLVSASFAPMANADFHSPSSASEKFLRSTSDAKSNGYKVKEKTLSRADGLPPDIDLSREAIQRAIRTVEAERVAFFSAEDGRRPGIDGPWAAGSPRAHNARVAALRVLTIDTSDKATCQTIAKQIASSHIKPARPEDKISNLCKRSKKNSKEEGNLAQIVLIEDQDPNAFQVNLDASFLTNTDRTLANDTRNLAIGMAGTMGVLWAMPGTTTGWDKEAIKNNPEGIFAEYKDNLKRGPVWDKDDKFFNYIAHPAAGAAYYTLSRHNGKSPLESFGYSVAMSTFFWEYGFEAFAEIPSIQDLIITPVFGAILGEIAYQYENRIRNNGGKLLGSKALGSAAMIVLNPAGALSESINSMLGSKVIKSAKADLVLKRYKPNDNMPGLSTMIGIQFTFLF